MKTLKNKIYEGFFDNIGGKELIFLKDLKDTLDRWKNSSDKYFPINQLERLCYKAQRENFNFDICIESSSKNKVLQYATLIKFWNNYYEVSDKPDGRPANNDCWTVFHATNIKNADAFNPPTVNCNTYIMGEYIDKFVKNYAEGSKRNIIFKVRISLDDPKHTKWM